jgi:hypothetical protein
VVRKQGRHKYFQLKGIEIAELIEKLLTITSEMTQPKVTTGPSNIRLKKARVCYDHLAGEFGVALYDALTKNGYIIDKENETILSEKGSVFFRDFGVNFNEIKVNKRPICKSCLDWSERRNHLAGILGQWILNDIFSKEWASKDLDSRAIEFSQRGLLLFRKKYKI